VKITIKSTGDPTEGSVEVTDKSLVISPKFYSPGGSSRPAVIYVENDTGIRKRQFLLFIDGSSGRIRLEERSNLTSSSFDVGKKRRRRNGVDKDEKPEGDDKTSG